MLYEAQITQLATNASHVHEALQEVIFLQKPNYSLLVFADGTVLPTTYKERGDTHWMAMVNEAKTYPYLSEVARQLGGKNPLSLLTFGDDDPGSACLAAFLEAAEFKQIAVEKINPPLKLRANGAQICGAKRGELIVWEDGSTTPKVGTGTAGEANASSLAVGAGQAPPPSPVKTEKKASPTTSTKVRYETTSRSPGLRKSNRMGQLILGCGGLSGLLTLCLVCVLLSALLGSSNTSQSMAEEATTIPPAVVEAVTTTPQPTLESSPTPTPTISQTPTSTPLPTRTPEPLTPAQIFALVSPSVAFINTPIASGSGVLIKDGYVITNAHVVWPFQEVRVVFPDGSEYLNAPVLNWDLLSDLAVIGPLQTSITPVALMDGEDSVIGSDVFLIGYPGEVNLFPKPTFTRGLISQLREWDTIELTYFQTDAVIAGGQSGGVLVSEKGEVIGISGFSIIEGKFGLVASAADVLPRVQRLIVGEDVADLGDRRLPLQGGQLAHSVRLGNFWDQRMYVINEPVGTPINIEVEGEIEAGFILLDAYGNVLIGADDGARGVKTGSITTDWTGPYFVLLSQSSELPGNFQLRSNRGLVPYNDMDDGARMTIGETIRANLDYPGDIDYFVIDLAAGDTINITGDSIMIDPFLVVDFTEATQEEIVLDDNSGGGLFGRDAKLAYQAPHSGSYFIVIGDAGGVEVGGYFLTVER